LSRTKKEPDLKWWEYLDWETMEFTWKRLPEEIKQVIRDTLGSPSYDVSEEKVIK